MHSYTLLVLSLFTFAACSSREEEFRKRSVAFAQQVVEASDETCEELRLDPTRLKSVPESASADVRDDLSGEVRLAIDVRRADESGSDRIAFVARIAAGGRLPDVLSGQSIGTCRACITYTVKNADGSTTMFVVSGGKTESFGVDASGASFLFTHVTLREWDMKNDCPVSAGRCLRTDKLQFSLKAGR